MAYADLAGVGVAEALVLCCAVAAEGAARLEFVTGIEGRGGEGETHQSGEGEECKLHLDVCWLIGLGMRVWW